ncbi:MAG: DUF3052 domain-containing protein [Dehalococcoidia bacterium]
MAGYSDTPLWKKLGIKEGSAFAVFAAPDGFELAPAELPPGALAVEPGAERVAVVLVFVTSVAVLSEVFPAAQGWTRQDGGLWVAWPKRASGVPTDLTENVIRELGIAAGMVDNKVCAIDETWSGLRFVVPLKDRCTG